MDLSKLAKTAGTQFKANSPAILTGIGAGGVIATGVLAAKGGMKAKELMWEAHSQSGIPDDKLDRLKEDAKLTWSCYIPAAAVGTATIAAILSANSISTRRHAAVAGLYSVTERAFKTFKEEVAQVVDDETVDKIHERVAQRNVADPETPTFVVGEGKILTLDSLSGRFFESTYESIRAAQNDLNAQCLNNVYASTNDWYRLLGLPELPNGDDTGWNSSNRLDIRITTTLTPENKPALCLHYNSMPSPNYYKGHGW